MKRLELTVTGNTLKILEFISKGFEGNKSEATENLLWSTQAFREASMALQLPRETRGTRGRPKKGES